MSLTAGQTIPRIDDLTSVYFSDHPHLLSLISSPPDDSSVELAMTGKRRADRHSAGLGGDTANYRIVVRHAGVALIACGLS